MKISLSLDPNNLTAVVMLCIYSCSLFIKLSYATFLCFIESLFEIGPILYFSELSKHNYLPESVNIFNACLKKCHTCQLLLVAVGKCGC